MGPSLLLVRYLWPLPVLCTWWNLQYFQLSDHRIMTKKLSYYLRLLATLYAFTSKYYCIRFQKWVLIFSTANLSLALFHLTNGLGENTPSHDLNMFNLRLCNATTIRYSLLNFGHIYLCGIDYNYFSPYGCKCNSVGCTATIRYGGSCHVSHSDSVYSDSEHNQFDSPMLVKREAGFSHPRRALIGSSQLWRVYDSPYYRA